MSTSSTAPSDEERLSGYLSQGPAFSNVLAPIRQKARNTLARALESIRRGPVSIQVPPVVSRGGNWLYYWARSATDRYNVEYEGLSPVHRLSYLKYSDGMDAWLREFPMLESLTWYDDVSFSHHRTPVIPNYIAVNFSNDHFKHFVHTYLLSSYSFRQRLERAQQDLSPDSVIVNIRRGDYYSVPDIKARYGIDTVTYVHRALESLKQDMTPSEFVIISDDPTWCLENLVFLSEVAPIRVPAARLSMFDDLAYIAAAHTMILTNTTFGYWGAYIADALRHTRVYVPNVHEYSPDRGEDIGIRDGRPFEHMQHWKLIEPVETTHWIAG